MVNNKIKYIHLRAYYAAEGNIPDACGGATIAYKARSLEEVEYFIAKCYHKDHFNKKLGRLISSGRLIKGMGVILKNVDVAVNSTIVKEIIEKYYQSEELEGNQEVRLFVK